MTDENKLLQRLQNRKEDALEEAIRLYTPYLSTVIYRAAGNYLTKEDTEEIAADVFLNLWKNAERIDREKGTIRSYLAGTARNQAYKRLREKKAEVSIEEIGAVTIETIPERNPDNSLWEAVAELGEEDAEIFVRFYRYGQPLKEIARAMGMKLSTVKTRLFRGKERLKQILTKEDL